MEKFMMSPSVSREDMNPHNVKVGNEFENNLLLTGKMIFTDSLSDLDCKVITGLLPLEKVKSDYENPDAHIKKYCKGLAVEFTVPNLDIHKGRSIAEYLFLKYNGLHIIINLSKGTMYVGRKFKRNEIYEEVNGVLRKL